MKGFFFVIGFHRKWLHEDFTIMKYYERIKMVKIYKSLNYVFILVLKNFQEKFKNAIQIYNT